MERIRDQFPLLERLAHCSPAKRSTVLKNIDPKLLLTLCECALNILHGNVPLNNQQEKRLKRHKHCLRLLADRQVSRGKKKKALLQRGSGAFLQSMLEAVLRLL